MTLFHASVGGTAQHDAALLLVSSLAYAQGGGRMGELAPISWSPDSQRFNFAYASGEMPVTRDCMRSCTPFDVA